MHFYIYPSTERLHIYIFPITNLDIFQYASSNLVNSEIASRILDMLSRQRSVIKLIYISMYNICDIYMFENIIVFNLIFSFLHLN